MFLIYKITNTINQKAYIGITSKKIEERWYQHKQDSFSHKDSYVFHAAIRKYGFKSFKVEVLEEGLTEEEAKNKETYYINFYDTFCGNNKGYNMTYGGDINTHFKGELSPVAKITEKDFWKIKDFLANDIISYKDIVERLSLNICDRVISDINAGKLWHHDDIDYPIRKNAKSISKVGYKNAKAKLTEEDVLQIITLLKNSSLSQSEIAQKFNVCYNTINLINRHKTWKYLYDRENKNNK